MVRLASALHQLAVERNFASLVETTLVMSQMLEQRTWSFCHPLSQFKDMNFKGMDIMSSINISIEELRAMPAKEIIDMARNRNMGLRILHAAKAFPLVTFDMVVKPITEGVIRIRLLITPDFKWDNSIHGGCQQYVAMVEDPMHDNIYHFEKFIITERNCSSGEPIELYFTVPLIAPHAEEYFVKIINLHFLREYFF